MAAELKPCPFCGSKNAAPYSVKSCHSVLCVACGGEGPEADSEEGATAAWNLRTPGVPACGACPGDGSICKTECRLAQESPPVPAAEWIQCDRCGKPWNRGAEPFGHACGVGGTDGR